MTNQWLIPAQKKEPTNENTIWVKLGAMEGISHEIIGGYDYMADGTLVEWDMIDGKRVDRK